MLCFAVEQLPASPDWVWALPVICCLAVGGSPQEGAQLAAGWLALNLALHLLEDVEDGDFTPDGEMDTPEKQLNIYTASIFNAYQFLSSLQSPEGSARLVNASFECGFKATQGQHMGFRPVPPQLEDAINAYWKATILKSGSLFRMACAGGAAASTDSSDLIDALGDCGTSIGVILQVLDDCRDMVDEKSGKREISLPVLLYSTALGGQGITHPASRASLQGIGVAEAITATLAAWCQPAQESLAAIKSQEAKKIMEGIVQSIVGAPAWGEAQ